MIQEARTLLGVALLTAAPLAFSCAYASPIQPAATSNSPFWYLGWGKPVQVVSEIPEGEQFRVSHRASTGYTPVSAVRSTAEARAREFCERKNLQMTPVTEQVSSAPHILGNFPRAEIVFVCSEKPRGVRSSPLAEDPYERLRRLKELLDAGVISQGEFEREKNELLAR
jgi:hypothetical protein